ncbi:MAG: hypothetical protein M3Q10_06050 [Chloroflexota bacterium]|nr:hypothetical protein [Chloroflexota bacterium]
MDALVIAIDWSSAVQGAKKKIWLAEAIDGRLVRLESGRDRDAVAAHLIAHAGAHPETVIGLDFAFSLPAWFVRERGWGSAHALWASADRDADRWLAAAKPPFWGKPGTRKPALIEHFRRTELDAPVTAGIAPKSVFQIGGAGSVGTGSLRGMRLLHRLHDAGFSIWPFDPPGRPRVVEIYPRLLTGPVVKKSAEARAVYLAGRYPDLDSEFASVAASGEDAFDAAVSALVMAAHLPRLIGLPAAADETARLEGLIWSPPSASDRPRRMPST